MTRSRRQRVHAIEVNRGRTGQGKVLRRQSRRDRHVATARLGEKSPKPGRQVGERVRLVEISLPLGGISGGQRRRVTLARGVAVGDLEFDFFSLPLDLSVTVGLAL